MTDPYRTEDERAARAKLLENQSKILEELRAQRAMWRKELGDLDNILGGIRKRVDALDMPDDSWRTIRWIAGMGALVVSLLILKADSCKGPQSQGVEEMEACGRLCGTAGVERMELDEDYHRVKACKCNVPGAPR